MAIRWYAGRHVQVRVDLSAKRVRVIRTYTGEVKAWERAWIRVQAGREQRHVVWHGCTQCARVTHTVHRRSVSRVRNESGRCAGCVRDRIVRIEHACVSMYTIRSGILSLPAASSSATPSCGPLWPVENDAFRNCAASLCAPRGERVDTRVPFQRVQLHEHAWCKWINR